MYGFARIGHEGSCLPRGAGDGAAPALGKAPRSTVDMPASAGRAGVSRSQDRPDLDAEQCRPGWRAEHAGRPRLRSAGPGRPCRRRGRPEAEGHAAGRGADHGRADGADRQYRERHACAPFRAALAGRALPEQQQRQDRRAAAPLPLHQRRQAGRGDARPGAGGRRRRARRPHRLRAQDQPLRRSRHLQGRSRPRSDLSPGPNSRRRP